MRIAVKKRLGMLEAARCKITDRPESNVIIYDPADLEERERAAREFQEKYPNEVLVLLPDNGRDDIL